MGSISEITTSCYWVEWRYDLSGNVRRRLNLSVKSTNIIIKIVISYISTLWNIFQSPTWRFRHRISLLSLNIGVPLDFSKFFNVHRQVAQFCIRTYYIYKTVYLFHELTIWILWFWHYHNKNCSPIKLEEKKKLNPPVGQTLAHYTRVWWLSDTLPSSLETVKK